MKRNPEDLRQYKIVISFIAEKILGFATITNFF